jgi:nucleoside-diphosphate kinase
MSNDKSEETLVLIKPDALKNSLTGYVLSQLAEFHTGLRFAATKIVQVDRRLAGEHYAEHEGKVFFPSLLEYITGRLHYPGEPWKQRVIAIVYQGKNAIKLIREIAGPTNPHIARDERPGCIRALGTVVPLKDNDGNVVGERMDNLIHASAHASDADREIKLWFTPNDVPPSMRTYETEVNEGFYYLKDNKLQTEHEAGSKCFLAPGSIAWKSDLEALSLIAQGKEAQCSLDAVVAKYLINEKQEI